MGQINLGSGSYKDYRAWTQTPAGQQSAANHRARYGDQSMSPFPRLWQPDRNWQQQLSEYRSQQSGPQVIGNAPNGRPATGAVTQTTKAPDMSAYSPGRAQPQQTSQGTPYSPPAAQQPAQPPYAMPQFDYEGIMRQAQEQMRQYYRAFIPQVASAAPVTQPVPPPPPVTTYGNPGQRDPYAGPAAGMYYRQPVAQPRQPRPTPSPGAPAGPIMGVQPAPQPFTFTIPPAVTSPADLPPEQRPPGFTQTFTDPFGNQTKNNPMAQRDALIQRINEESLPYYMGRPGQFNPNLQELWGQAGNMVSNGWANPLAGLFG